MKKVLFYPGTFNPPHYGHVSAVTSSLEAIDFDEIWIMPSGKRVDKEISTSFEDRRNLGNLLVEHLRTLTQVPIKMIATGLEEDAPYTHEIILELKANSEDEIFQLCGIDGFMGIKERVIGPNEKFVLIKRPGYEFPEELLSSNNLTFLEEIGDISSTKIREMVKNGDEGYRKLVPDSVSAYVKEKGLYR